MKLKTLLGALAMAATAQASYAADLGGNCCADIEERVSELEATTARKGNRKMSLMIYGQVSRSIMFYDGSGFNRNTDNPNSPSRIGVVGDAKIGANAKAGYQIEMRFLSADPATFPGPTSVSVGQLESIATVSYANVWIEHKVLGRGTIGFLSEATDGITEISTANTAVAALAYVGGDGSRVNGLRYDTPSFAGFTASASLGSQRVDVSPATLAFTPTDRRLALAVRYANELGGFKVAAGVGYHKETENIISATNPYTVSGSASLMHAATGLFATGAATNTQGLGTNWMVQGGIEKNFFGFGATTLYGEYAKAADGQALATFWGGISGVNKLWGMGVVQSFDAAALDLFAAYRNIEGEAAYLAGARIKF